MSNQEAGNREGCEVEVIIFSLQTVVCAGSMTYFMLTSSLGHPF